MARKMQILNHMAVSHAKTRGYLADGGGLYLQISANGARSWVSAIEAAAGCGRWASARSTPSR
jgi:hypothetical protein